MGGGVGGSGKTLRRARYIKRAGHEIHAKTVVVSVGCGEALRFCNFSHAYSINLESKSQGLTADSCIHLFRK